MASPTPDSPPPAQPNPDQPASGPAHFAPGLVERLFFERLMESLPDVVYFKDREGRFVCINNAHAKHLGLRSPAQAVGKSDYDFFPAELAIQKDADEREIVKTGIGIKGKEESSKSLAGIDRWVLTTKLPLFGPQGEIIGTFGISRDITEAARARKSLQEQHQLLRTLIEILPTRVSIKDREGRIRLVNEAFRSAWGLKVEDDIEGKLLSELVTDSRTAQIAADDRSVLEDGTHILNREEQEVGPRGEKRWILLSKVPLRDAEGLVQGIVSAGTDITAQKEAEARALAAQHALEEKNEQMEAELALACELQTELMTSSLQAVSVQLDPAAPFRPRMSSLYEPSAHLAGDFFYLNVASPTTFGLLLCDVMGHGLKAALVTTLLRGLVNDLKAETLRPSAALEQLNERLCSLLDRPSMPRFVTAIFARVDIAAGIVEIANAGHPWPLIKSELGTVSTVCSEDCDPALGLIRGASFTTHSLQLTKGNELLFFTDGLIEEVNPAGEEFGMHRLAAALARSRSNSPEAVMADISASIRKFSTSDTHRDDYCALLASF